MNAQTAVAIADSADRPEPEQFGSTGSGFVRTECELGNGLAFDQKARAWSVSVVSNRLVRIAPDGSQTVWLEDAEPGHLTVDEAAYETHTLDPPHLDGVRGRSLRTLRRPVAGVAPIHWSYP